MDWLIRGAGLFYALSGVVLVRAMALDKMAGTLEAMLAGAVQRKDRIRHYWLRLGAALTVASGLAMVLLGAFTVPLMLANCLVQGGWLVYARSQFPPEDEDEALGRRRTTNAFLVYLLVTALTILAFASGAVVLHGGAMGSPWDLVATWLPVAGGVAVFIAMLVG
jgi:hypothetical protein